MNRKRGAETSGRGDLGFHYDREERMGDRGEREPSRGGIFQRNRSLAITLLDLLLVLIIFALYMVFFRPGANDALARFDGYTVDGSAFVFETDVYVTVTVELSDDGVVRDDGVDREDRVVQGGGETLVRLEFPDGTGVTDVLPSDPDFPTTIRHVFSVDALGRGDRESVPAVIETLGRESTLEIPIVDD